MPDAEPAVGRARRAVARRTIESLSVRHEPRLVRAVAARDARPDEGVPRMVPAGRRRSPRDGRQLDLLLRAAGRSAEPATSRRRSSAGSTPSAAPTPQRFDERGFSYFIREVYDSFYPGYGESWPIFHGAVGMTYEQASARGLRFRREDGAHPHVSRRRASITSPRRSPRRRPRRSNREKLLRDFLEFRRGAVQEGEQGPVREFLLPPGGDPSRAERLARLLDGAGLRGAARGRASQGRHAAVSGGHVPRVGGAAGRDGCCATCSTHTWRSPKRS